MKNIILFDIDGTVADNTHRQRYIVPPTKVEKEHLNDVDALMDDLRFCRCSSCRAFYGEPHCYNCVLVKEFKKDWEGFFSEQHLDRPVPEAVTLLLMLKEAISNPVGTYFDLYLAFLTGRPEKYRQVTEEWLYDNNLWSPESVGLIMRPDGDQTDDHVLKLKQAEEHFGLDNILCVFEDRARIVKAFRDAGVFVCHVAEGNF